MNKKLLSALILISGLITLISLSSVYSSVTWQNQGQNDTYVDFRTAIVLSAQGYADPWYLKDTYDVSSFSSRSNGIATNMTSWSDGCCLFLHDVIAEKIRVVNTSGVNIQNISLPAAITCGAGIWTNASGTAVTDFWIADYCDDFLYHLNADGTFSSDATGNFSVATDGGNLEGVWSNVTSGVPTTFYLVDKYDSLIYIYTATGTNTANITLDSAVDNPYDITSNDTSMTPNNFWIINSGTGMFYHVDGSGAIVDSQNISEMGYPYVEGLTGLKRTGDLDEAIISEINDDKLGRFLGKNLSYAILATNETGAWTNSSKYGSPMLLNARGVTTWSNFTWTGTGVDCNKVIGWKIYYNDTQGNENVTSVKSFYHIPFVNDTSYALSKITSATCEDKNNITLTFDTTPAGRVSVIMPLVYFDSTSECSYEGSEGTRVTIYNESEYCWIRLNHSALSSGDTIKIYKTKSLRVEPPPNLPAALTAAAVGLIIVIYFIVSKEEES